MMYRFVSNQGFKKRKKKHPGSNSFRQNVKKIQLNIKIDILKFRCTLTKLSDLSDLVVFKSTGPAKGTELGLDPGLSQVHLSQV